VGCFSLNQIFFTKKKQKSEYFSYMKNLSFFFLQILHLSDQDNVAIFYKIWQQKITPLSKLTGSFLMGTDKHNPHNA
jgi:hypothetical protein